MCVDSVQPVGASTPMPLRALTKRRSVASRRARGARAATPPARRRARAIADPGASAIDVSIERITRVSDSGRRARGAPQGSPQHSLKGRRVAVPSSELRIATCVVCSDLVAHVSFRDTPLNRYQSFFHC